MSIYSDKLAHVQVVINSPYSVAQMCTREETLAHKLGTQYFDDILSYNSLTTTLLARHKSVLHREGKNSEIDRSLW